MERFEPEFISIGELLSIRNSSDDSERTGLQTGFNRLDEMLGGLNGGDFVVIGGRPAMGKTALALNMISSIAVENKVPCMVLSLEETKERMLERLVSMNEGQCIEKLSQSQIFISDDPTITMAELGGQCRKRKKENDIGLIIIDGYNDSSLGENKRAQSALPRTLKRLALELDTPIVLFSNISRTADYRKKHIPMISDLENYNEFIHFADAILFLLRDDYYSSHSKKSRSIAKLYMEYHRRNRMTGCVALEWQEAYNSFREPILRCL